MAHLVRVLWDKSLHERIDPELEISRENTRGDAATNFRTEDCRLSVFRIRDEADIALVAAAVASQRKGLDDVDYCVLDGNSIEAIGCYFDDAVPGETHFNEINAMHVDLCGLNISRLAELVYVAVSTGRVGRVRGRHVRRLLLEAVATHKVDPVRFEPGLRKGLGLAETG